jgi:hypothetical protein
VVEGFVRCSTLLFSDWSIFVRLVKNTLVVWLAAHFVGFKVRFFHLIGPFAFVWSKTRLAVGCCVSSTVPMERQTGKTDEVFFQDLVCYMHATEGTQSTREVGYVADDGLIPEQELVLKKMFLKESCYLLEKEAYRRISQIDDP